MKKTSKLLSIMTSMALFTCAAVVPMSSDAAVVSDNTKAEIESGNETIHVRIDYSYDVSYVENAKKELYRIIDELTEQYINGLDKSQYSAIELRELRSDYSYKLLQERVSAYNEQIRKELFAPIMEDIGIDSEREISYPYDGIVYCDLSVEEISKAEMNKDIIMVSVDKDYNEYGNYIGTPNPYVQTGTTTTASSTTAITSTTVTTASTMLEEYGTAMFTDTIEDINEFTITFKEHGKYRYLSNAIRDKLMVYKTGSEIIIGFEYLRVNADDTPRIDKIIMLSRSKLDLGDPTGDSMIDARDASFVLAEYSLLSTGGASHLTTVEKTAADANKDGQIDSKDASLMLGMYAYNATSENKIETMNSYIEYLKTNE